MKIAGLVLIFAGVLALLKNIGMIITWNIVWPIALIFIGFAVKHTGQYRMFGGGCESKEMNNSNEKTGCEGGACGGGGCGNCEK